MKKALFLVPHEDDELFVGGPLLINLSRSDEYEVFVFIATNGDSVPYESKCRIKESLKVLSAIGVKRDHIIFGGYGDSWDGVHIYNTEDDTVKASHAGATETYFPLRKGFEWHYIRNGEHALYTKNNYKEDIHSLLETINADVVVCVDMDVNTDHRCLSLLTDAAMGQLLKERPEYRPLYLKKYSYYGVLFGDNDYFIYPNPVTRQTADCYYNPFLKWEDRVRYSVPDDCNTLLIKDNFLYKLAKLYKSQEIKFNIGRFANSDVAYWKRNTDNLALKAKINATSGDVSYLNDFLFMDSDDITVRNCDFSKRCWRPDKSDKNPSIDVYLDCPKKVDKIVLYFINGGKVTQKPVSITLYDSDDCVVQELETLSLTAGLYHDDITLMSDNNSIINRVSFRGMEAIDDGIGISEIEILSDSCESLLSEFAYKEEKKGNPKDYPNENAIKMSEKKKLLIKRKLYDYLDFYRWRRRLHEWKGRLLK